MRGLNRFDLAALAIALIGSVIGRLV